MNIHNYTDDSFHQLFWSPEYPEGFSLQDNTSSLIEIIKLSAKRSSSPAVYINISDNLIHIKVEVSKKKKASEVFYSIKKECLKFINKKGKLK